MDPLNEGSEGREFSAGSVTEDSIARTIGVIAIANVAQSVGFDAIQESAADALADILGRYIQRIGLAAKNIAELAGRTQSDATDVMQALHDMIPAPVELSDLVKALETSNRPFPREIPSFPIDKHDTIAPDLDRNAIGQSDQIPAYAPRFAPSLPSRETYSVARRTVVHREHDAKNTRLLLLEQKNQVQQSLHGLHVAFEKRAELPRELSVQCYQSSNTPEGGAEKPFLRATMAQADEKSLFQAPKRAFLPLPLTHKAAKELTEATYDTTSKSNTTQELGKEEKILAGTFHDGDSE